MKVTSLLAAASALVCASSLPGLNAASRNHALEVLRGGAWSFHLGGDPCGDVSRSNCSFASPPMAETTLMRGPQSEENPGDMERMPPVLEMPYARLPVSPQRINHLDPLGVSFELKYATPNATDWIGVYCNDDESRPLPDIEYIDWRYTNGADSATLQFGPLVNMRCSWQFRYFAASAPDGRTNVRLGVSRFVRFTRGNKEPLQAVAAPTVIYGRDSAALTQCVVAVGDSYTASDMCYAPATTVAAQHYRNPGTLYSAVMTGLVPEQAYFYQVGDAATSTLSPVFKFRTGPAPGKSSSSGKPMSFFVYGDLGDWNIKATGPQPEERTATTIELMRRDLNDPARNYIATMHNGDISYALSRTYLWDQFGALVQPVATQIPYMIGIGNHEYCYTSGGDKDPSGAPDNGYHPPEGNYGSDSWGECGVPTNKRFIMPANGNRVFWWSVEYGLAHHTQISSEHDFTPGSPMYQWLENDLKSVDRAKTPWLFVYLHRPIDYRLSLFIRKNLEPLLATYKVDIVFSGHYHAYELTCPVYKEKCLTEAIPGAAPGLAKAKAPMHILVGSAGADVDNIGYFDVPWRIVAELNYGYGRVHVHNATHVEWEFVRNKTRAVTSSAWVISDHDWVVEA
ncbi:hypothetical protein PybrP1_001726 [[Pythium] brassicae (nom. inval.)]|nr:hypothetical protein PybrP1_001726 [[Pythium] brassicae (nom. inval.)]